MGDRPRRLSPARLDMTAAWLEAVAAELRAAHAGQVQDLLMAAADTTWPSSTGPTPPGGPSADTPVERSALGRPESVATSSRAVLAWLNGVERAARRAHAILTESAPGRLRWFCTYGHPIKTELSRCTYRDADTGAQCGTRADTARACSDCREPETKVPASKLKQYRAGEQRLWLCAKDYKWRRDHQGRPRASVARLLADASELVASDGTFSTTTGTSAG